MARKKSTAIVLSCCIFYNWMQNYTDNQRDVDVRSNAKYLDTFQEVSLGHCFDLKTNTKKHEQQQQQNGNSNKLWGYPSWEFNLIHKSPIQELFVQVRIKCIIGRGHSKHNFSFSLA